MNKRHRIAVAVGLSPLILALLVSLATIQGSTLTHGTELQAYLIQHREHISQSLIVSSLLVAVFCSTLRSRIVALLGGSQAALTLAALVLPHHNMGPVEILPYIAITVLPVAVLLALLRKDIETESDEGETD